MRHLLSVTILSLLLAAATRADDDPARTEDVIYGRKFGTALTLDVFTPKKANGAAIVHVISGGWFSSHQGVNPGVAKVFTDRGYTVFAVVHGSQPKFTIPEIMEDMHRSVRFIRHNAKKYQIDPGRIGITGGSAGGHLSLMMGTTGNDGNAKSNNPIDRTSSRVQAVACFFPPTDFLNYGEKGKIALGCGTLVNFKAPFDFQEFDPKTRSFVPVRAVDKLIDIGRQISPVYHVSSDDAPSLIIHGDADKLVPIQQAELIVARLKDAGVAAELIVKKGQVHGWKGMDKDLITFADWFDRHLKKVEAK